MINEELTFNVGDEYPVWWETYDKRPGGQHKAKIFEVMPYRGKFTEHFTVVLKLTAPKTKKGYVEMAV
jgi:hypothetical protein